MSQVINTFLARTLLEPAFLHQLKEDPVTAIQCYQLNKSLHAQLLNLEVKTLVSFAAFVAQVQHNFLWDIIPGTKELLKFYDLELDSFSSYLLTEKFDRSVSRDQKISNYFSFFDSYVNQLDEVKYVGLKDIFLFEKNGWLQERETVETRANERIFENEIYSLTLSTLSSLRPRVSGKFWIGKFSYCPIEITKMVTGKRFNPKALTRNPKRIVIWKNAVSRKCFEVNENTALLLYHIEKEPVLTDILKNLELEWTDLGPAIEQLKRTGLVYLQHDEEKM